MSWTIPVYDRTLADVTNGTAKGFFNVVDWVRINGNTEYVAALIEVLRGVNVDLNVVSVPDVTTIPTADEINAFVSNIEELRASIGLAVTSDLVELETDYHSGGSAAAPDYEDVNAWEKNLSVLKRFLVNSSYYGMVCGVPGAGQQRYWQVRFRDPFIRDDPNPKRRARTGVGGAGVSAIRQNKFRRYSI